MPSDATPSADPVRLTVVDGVGVIAVDNPPVNALSAAVRASLVEAVGRAEADPAVEAAVILCRGRTFMAGADITEFGQPIRPPSLPDVVAAIERSTKPVVAAIHGTALGGGLEVALGCHWRIAERSARLGLPEVKLGLLPGAGGTQRLPRLVGVPEALGMIALGEPVSAVEALDMGLVDRLADHDLETEALAYAREIAERGLPPPRVSERPVPGGAAAALFDDFLRANARRFRGLEAPAACLEAVRAAVALPFDEGLARERALFLELMNGDQSPALRHVFFAERKASKVLDLPRDTPLRSIERVGVVGAGTMGAGIAMAMLNAGLSVVLVEQTAEALDRGVGTIRGTYDAGVAKGRMTAAEVEARLARLAPILDFDALADRDLIVEAVFEDMVVKQAVFARLDAIARPDAILATNSSYLDVDEIAAATSRPGSVVGLHFFSPAHLMKLLEVVRGDRTAPDVLATALALARRIGKVAVVAGVCHGFIGNRMLARRQREATRLAAEGVLPWDVDRVIEGFGFPMGPFAMADLAGLDIGWSPGLPRGDALRDRLCELGRRGQKTGAGFYDYAADRRRTPSPVTEQLVRDFAAEAGAAPRPVSDEEILERCLYPMIDEGARILDEGVAQRASDIDVVWVHGYGWPAWRGGPMFWADRLGAAKVVAGLERQAETSGEPVEISPLLVRLARDGGRFGDL